MMSGTHGYGIVALIEIHLLGRKEDFMKECCGNCKYNKRDFSKPQNSGYAEFCCGNEDSSEYGVPTFFDDTCDDFEEKE